MSVSVDRIFEYIRDFPETISELKCLREYLQETRTYKELTAVLQKQLRSRLLIPGAHTKDILKMYVRTLKTLEYLLQEMRQWHLITETSDLVVGYLLRRKDAVKCVVAAMLGDDDVLEESEALEEAMNEVDSEISGDEVGDLDWVPPPFRVRGGEGEWSEEVEDERQRGVVQMLVAVFGGREKFLGEFRGMLSSRLLQIGSSYECEREAASLEMMKLKFGEDDLVDCQVMLKDISNSRRINHAVHEVISDNLSNLSALIISRHYWPNSTTSTSRSFLPNSLESLLEEYAAAYHKLRPSQRLEWRRDAGVVDITVEFAQGQSADFRVSPVQVAVLSLFEGSGPSEGRGLSVEEVGRQLQLPNEAAKRELAFWVHHNVLAEIDVNRFALVKL